MAEGWTGLTPEGEELVAEGHLVSPGDPANDNGGKGVEGHECGIDSPFLLNDAAVEDN